MLTLSAIFTFDSSFHVYFSYIFYFLFVIIGLSIQKTNLEKKFKTCKSGAGIDFFV